MSKDILIIHTGGTIGMKPTERGYDVEPGYLSELISALPQLSYADMPNFEVIEHTPLIDSANVTPKFWGRVAEDIVRYYDEFAGFVVLHGTDTMAYSSSALSFILENLNKPVIFTGSQAPLVETRTDARDNLINSLYIASQFELNQVALCFHNVLLRGNRAKKVSSTKYQAFASPNAPAIAKIETEIKFNSSMLQKAPTVRFSARNIKELNIANISLFPGIKAHNFERLLDADLDALIVGTYGMGNAPIADKELMHFFQGASEQDVLLVNYSQCQHGKVNMSTYSVGQKLADIGFVSAHDMTMEAVITKLYYLLSCDLALDEVKKQMQVDLRGELTK